MKQITYIVRSGSNKIAYEYAKAYDDNSEICSWGSFREAYHWSSKEMAKEKLALASKKHVEYFEHELIAKVLEVHSWTEDPISGY